MKSIVETTAEQAITDELLNDGDQRLLPCFTARQVMWRYTLLSADRRRMICSILVGNYRNNHISGLDALCGGSGKDVLDGGTGNGMTYGGNGRDVHIGNTGRDVFVVDLDAKSVDLFKDFQMNRDRIGLPFALHPNMIDIVNHQLGAALKLGTDTLAILQGIKPNQIEANNFVQVGFATIRGVEVPYVAP